MALARNTPDGIYLLKVTNRNTRTRCEVRLKLTIKSPTLLIFEQGISIFQIMEEFHGFRKIYAIQNITFFVCLVICLLFWLQVDSKIRF